MTLFVCFVALKAVQIRGEFKFTSADNRWPLPHVSPRELMGE